MSDPRSAVSPERWDLETLALATLLVPLVWLVSLGWSPSLSAGSHDQVAQNYLLVRDLFGHAGGDWTRTAYRAELLGGAKLHDVMGTLPIFPFFAWLRLSPLAAMNGVLFVAEIACAFFGVRLAFDVATLLGGDEANQARRLARHRGLPRLAIIALCAFSPTMAWNLTTGHYELVFGALLAVNVLAIFASFKARTTTFTLAVVTVAVQLQAFQTTGQEPLYGAIFLGPALLLAALPFGRSRVRELALPVAFTLGCLALSIPKLAGMWSQATGSDAGRGVGAASASVIYSYVTATAHDWIASIPWGMELIPSEREVGFWHEINFGFGPPLVLIGLYALSKTSWPQGRKVGLALLAGFVLALLFSMDAPGVAWLLTHVCPPIAAFRVPERAVLSFALVLPPIAVAPLLVRRSTKATWATPAGTTTVALTAGVVVFFVPQGAREALVWLLVLGVTLPALAKWAFVAQLPAGVLLTVLAFGSLAAFRERLRPYSATATLIDKPAALGAQMRSLQPELASPLVRIVVHFDLDDFQTNTAYAMGLSSLSGYINPPRRFVALEAALAGAEENVLRNFYRLDESAPSFALLQPLYNVKVGVFPEGRKLRLSPVGLTAGAAWFSAAITRVDSVQALAADLRATQATLATEAHRQAWVVATDDAVRAASLPAVVAPECARATVQSVDAVMGSQTVRVHVESPTPCPLTLAMNFTTNLHATTPDGTTLTMFPSYGALAAVWVPAGTREVVVEARAIVPAWTSVAWWLGLGLTVLGFALTRNVVREQRATRQTPVPVS